jgi:ribosomal protein L4
MKQLKTVEFIQWVWKTVFNIEKSKTVIRNDLKAGAIKLNDRKLTEKDIIIHDDK